MFYLLYIGSGVEKRDGCRLQEEALNDQLELRIGILLFMRSEIIINELNDLISYYYSRR